MEGTYEIMQGAQSVGTVQVTRQGMFYCIRCQCKISGEVAFRLMMTVDGTETDLGILSREKTHFGLQCRVNVKMLGKGKPVFSVRPKRNKDLFDLIQIFPEEPFGYLDRLEKAYIAKKNNKILIGFQVENK